MEIEALLMLNNNREEQTRNKVFFYQNPSLVLDNAEVFGPMDCVD